MSKGSGDYDLAFRFSLRDRFQIILFRDSDHRATDLGAVYHQRPRRRSKVDPGRRSAVVQMRTRIMNQLRAVVLTRELAVARDCGEG